MPERKRNGWSATELKMGQWARKRSEPANRHRDHGASQSLTRPERGRRNPGVRQIAPDQSSRTVRLFLLKIADRIDPEAHDLASLEALNCGKLINCALEDERPAIANTFPLKSAKDGFDCIATMDSQVF
jgi:hypothetical protein